MKWLEISTKDTKLISGLFPMTETINRRSLGYLSWTIDSMKGLPTPLCFPPTYLQECNSWGQLEVRSLEYVILTINYLLELIFKNPTKENKAYFLSTLKNVYRKFSTIRRLWLSLSNCNEPKQLQGLICFQAMLYHLITDMELQADSIPWTVVNETCGLVKTKFLENIGFRNGFAIIPPLFQAFWDKLAGKIVKQPNKFLISVLEFFLTGDLVRTAKDEKNRKGEASLDGFTGAVTIGKNAMGSGTIKSDLAALFDLFDEHSQNWRIWSGLSPFTCCHLIFEFLQYDLLKDYASQELRNIFKKGHFPQQANFIPTEFLKDAQPQPLLVSSAYAAIYEDFNTRIKDRIECFTRLVTMPNPHTFYESIVNGALLVCFFQKTADELTKSENLEKTIQGWENDFLTTLTSQLEGNLERQLFFLQSIRSTDRINELLCSRELCIKLKLLQELHIREELKSARFYLFPFTFQANTPEGEEYRTIDHLMNAGDQEALKDSIIDLVNKDPTGYLRARLYLATSAYYGFYNLSKVCPILPALLSDQNVLDLLHLIPDEVKAYQLLASGGVPGEPNDDVFWFFSNAKREHENVDLTMRHLLANVLIVTLGSPAASNHFYTRIFTPQFLSKGVRGPGSTFPNEQDCGYYLEDNGEINVRDHKYANIFGGSRLYCLAFNFMTWGSKGLALLVDTTKNHHHIGAVCLHGDYRTDKSVAGAKIQALPDHLVLKKYLMQRPNMFYYWLCQEQNLIQANIEPHFFVTQSLYFMWKDIVSNIGKAEGSMYKGVFNHESETLKYENRIKEFAFDFVMKNCAELKKPYEAMIIDGSFQQVFEKRNFLTEHSRKAIRVLSHQLFIQASAGTEEFPMIVKFKNYKRYRTIKHLPFLVKIYYWVNQKMANMFTEDEVLELTFKQAIEKLPNEDRKNGDRTFLEMQRVWDDILENHPNYQVCQIAAAGGEGDIPKFDENFLLRNFISLKQADMAAFDHVYRVTKDIVDLQNRLIQDKTFEYEVAFFPNDLNPFSMLLEIESDEDAIGWARYYADIHPQTGFFYDFDAIEKKLTEKYLKQLAKLEINNLRRVFKFKQQDDNQLQEMDWKKLSNEDTQDNLSIITIFSKSLKNLPTSFQVEDKELEPNWNARLMKWSEKELLSLIQTLAALVRKVQNLDEQPNSSSKLLDFMMENGIPFITEIKALLLKLLLPFKSLNHFSMFVIKIYHEKNYLFSEIGDALNTEKLPTELEKELVIKFLENKTSSQLKLLQKLAELLLNETNLRIMTKVTEKSISKILKNPLATLGEGYDKILPKNVLCKHLGSCLREIHKACGKLQLFLLSNSNREGGYKELIPNNFVEQNELEGTKPFELIDDSFSNEPEDFNPEPQFEVDVDVDFDQWNFVNKHHTQTQTQTQNQPQSPSQSQSSLKIEDFEMLDNSFSNSFDSNLVIPKNELPPPDDFEIIDDDPMVFFFFSNTSI